MANKNKVNCEKLFDAILSLKTKEECAALGTLEVLSNPEIIRRSFVAKSR